MPTDTHVHIWIALLWFLGGGGSVKYLVYVAKSMPPLPKDAGWWLTFFYSLVKGLSGTDPTRPSFLSTLSRRLKLRRG